MLELRPYQEEGVRWLEYRDREEIPRLAQRIAEEVQRSGFGGKAV